MAEQPEEEKNAKRYKDKLYGLIKRLPGQRTAAKCWCDLFQGVVVKYGGKMNHLLGVFVAIHLPKTMF